MLRHTGVLSCVVLINSVLSWAARANGAASFVAAPANRRCAALYLVLFGLIRQLPLLREKFRLNKFTLHSGWRRRAASRRALLRPHF